MGEKRGMSCGFGEMKAVGVFCFLIACFRVFP